MNTIKLLTLTILLIITSFNILKAQEVKETSMPYKGGTLKFAYYEKDGVRIPHGMMEYSSDKYSERGENIDGYKEGEWQAINKTGIFTRVNTFTYKKGFLDGKTIMEEKKTNNKTQKEDLVFKNEFTFKNGHLYGENKIIVNSDTLYCNFDEKGEKVGTWKIIADGKTKIGEYSDGKIVNAFELDELGQKKETFASNFDMTAILKLTFFDSTEIQQIPYSIRESRPILPSLLDLKYGMYSSTKPIP